MSVVSFINVYKQIADIMSDRRYGTQDEDGDILSTYWVLIVVVFASIYFGRKYFTGIVLNKGIGISHAVSRRRRILRDPTSRRPPPLISHVHLSNDSSTSISHPQQIGGIVSEEDLSSSMPGGAGRRIPRSARPPGAQLPPGPLESSSMKYSSLGGSGSTEGDVPLAPKHMPFPNIPVDGELFFEILMFVFTTVAAGLQFQHIYRSVWWLPHAYTHHVMNFYLIDIHLVMFILVIFARRLIYMLGCVILERFSPVKFRTVVFKIYRVALLFAIFAELSLCGYYVVQTHPIVNIFYLCYPVSVYLILFGLKISPFFELSGRSGAPGPGGTPLHSCSGSAPFVRQEVESLKTDFNARMKQVLFSSVLNAYYAGFVPCCFAQSFVFYDVYNATLHLIFVGVGCFTLYAGHMLPPRYCDVLHRSALHLGSWARVEPRAHLPVAYNWAPDTLWPHGALVRHARELYKARGWFNAAEPGNSSHTRFHSIFKNPSVALSGLLGLQLTLVVVQLALLIRSSQWQQIISLTHLLFVNYYTLFRLGRDYLIALKIYKAEQTIHEKNLYQ